MNQLTIIIVNWNTRDYLKDCLNSIFQKIKQIKFNVIVVDNNSLDGNLTMMKQRFPQIELIQNKENVGYARANNQGIKRSSAPYILILNPDILIQSGSIEIMLDFLEKNPGVGACGPQILDGRYNPVPPIKYPSLLHTISLDTVIGKIVPFLVCPQRKIPPSPQRVKILSGSCLMLRRAALEEAGLFNEIFFLYCEEAELLRRFRKNNWDIYYLPQTKIIHFKEQSSVKMDPLKVMMIGKISSFQLWRIEYGNFLTVCFKIILFSLWLVNLLYWVQKIPFDKKKAVKKINIYKKLLSLILKEKINQ